MASVEPSQLDWQGELGKTKFVFYQGRLQSQLHAASYIGNHPFVSTTNEQYSCPWPTVFTMRRESLWVYPELPEVVKKVGKEDGSPRTWSERCSEWAFYAKSHLKGWWLGEAVPVLIDDKAPDYQPCYPLDEEGSLSYFQVNNLDASLAQETDKNAHRARILAMQKQAPENEHTVLYGVSRGAATTFSALAAHHSLYKNVKLCVLEAPFDSIEGLAQTLFKSQRLGAWLYQQDGLRKRLIGERHLAQREQEPRGHATTYPNHIPTVMVSSIVDDVVPHKNTIRLALRVAIKRLQARESGEEVAPFYFLQLDTLRHVQYCYQGSDDALRYERFIHYLYRKNGLPHVQALAESCEENDEITDLTSMTMAPLIKAQQHYWQNKPDRLSIREEALKALLKQLDDSVLELKDKRRILLLAKEMPLFSARIEQATPFFSQKVCQNRAVEQLSQSLQELGDRKDLVGII